MKVISGGQTGADFGALLAARDLGLPTGGMVPKGWRTDTGPNPSLADFGLREHPSAAYQPRTRSNVKAADATLIFGNLRSPGCRLTACLCLELARPMLPVPWHSGEPIPSHDWVRAWLSQHGYSTLNVAGNREAKQPGIELAVRTFLTRCLEK